MREIIIKNQSQFDKIPLKPRKYIVVYIDSKDTINVTYRENCKVEALGNSSVIALGNSSVKACDNSSVKACDNSSVIALGNSSVEACDNSSVIARGNSSVEACDNSSVKAWDNSLVKAWDNSSVKAWDNSSVKACDNSSVIALGNSSVEAWDNSSVKAWDNSSVKAWDNSSVKALGNSSVKACDNSSVIALGNSGIHLYSDLATVTLFSFSVCWELSKKKAIKKSKTATIIRPKIIKGVDAWLEREAIKNNKKVVLFKKVSKDLKTQEDTPNETHWKIGTTLIHHNWRPRDNECGEGKFHACSRTYFCDEFRNEPGDRYIAIEIDKKDLFVWDNNPDYPHKIAFRKGKVLYEVDKIGRKI